MSEKLTYDNLALSTIIKLTKDEPIDLKIFGKAPISTGSRFFGVGTEASDLDYFVLYADIPRKILNRIEEVGSKTKHGSRYSLEPDTKSIKFIYPNKNIPVLNIIVLKNEEIYAEWEFATKKTFEYSRTSEGEKLLQNKDFRIGFFKAKKFIRRDDSWLLEK